MDVVRAAQNTDILLSKSYPDIPALRAINGQSSAHARWCLGEVANGNITGEKAHRWLGYAQGVLVQNGHLTLEACKHANVLA